MPAYGVRGDMVSKACSFATLAVRVGSLRSNPGGSSRSGFFGSFYHEIYCFVHVFGDDFYFWVGGFEDSEDFVCESLANGGNFVEVENYFFEVFEAVEDSSGLGSGDVDCSHCVEPNLDFCFVECKGGWVGLVFFEDVVEVSFVG